MSPTTIIAADRLECCHAPRPWAFDTQRAAQIDAYWDTQTRGNPKLYDGLVLLSRDVRTSAGAQGEIVLSMDFFETRFSRFLAWRDFGFPDESVFNCFAMPALRSSDGAFLLGEMAPGHSSAGQLYFPAGTPDMNDVVNGAVDLEGSIIRELAEEAGIEAKRDDLSPAWTIVFHRQQIACMKIIDWPEPAKAILEKVTAYIASEEHPELSAAHMIDRRTQLADPRLPEFMTAFLEAVLPD